MEFYGVDRSQSEFYGVLQFFLIMLFILVLTTFIVFIAMFKQYLQLRGMRLKWVSYKSNVIVAAVDKTLKEFEFNYVRTNPVKPIRRFPAWYADIFYLPDHDIRIMIELPRWLRRGPRYPILSVGPEHTGNRELVRSILDLLDEAFTPGILKTGKYEEHLINYGSNYHISDYEQVWSRHSITEVWLFLFWIIYGLTIILQILYPRYNDTRFLPVSVILLIFWLIILMKLLTRFLNQHRMWTRCFWNDSATVLATIDNALRENNFKFKRIDRKSTFPFSSSKNVHSFQIIDPSQQLIEIKVNQQLVLGTIVSLGPENDQISSFIENLRNILDNAFLPAILQI
jgi:hypothetical protein